MAVAAIRGDKTLAELSEQFDVHQNQIQDWRRKLLDHADQVFGRGGSSPSESELVDKQENVSRELVRFCGLEWDKNCLDFQKFGRLVYTVSYEQVKQPIYTRSLERWKNYDRHLDALKEALADIHFTSLD